MTGGRSGQGRAYGRAAEIRRAAPVRQAILLGTSVLACLLVAVNGVDFGNLAGVMAGLSAVLAVAVGAILIVRVTGNAVGWLLWLGGLLLATTLGMGGLATYGLVTHPGSIPGAIWLAWIGATSAALTLPLLAGFLPLVYPTGRLLSARWRIVAAIGIADVACSTAAAMFGTGSADTYPPGFGNPLLVTGPVGSLVAAMGAVAQPLGALLLLASVMSVAIRFRRSHGVERQQIKWFAWTAAVVVVALAIAATLTTSNGGILAALDTVAWTVTFTGIALLPVAIGIAILRYRLYDIDRIVSRTIAWSTVTAVLAGVFVGVMLALQAVLAPITGSSTVAVAGSTLLVFALFQPLTRRVRHAVDRRFDRARYDADRSVAALAGRLRDEVDLDHIRLEVLGAVDEALRPGQRTLWLRDR